MAACNLKAPSLDAWTSGAGGVPRSHPGPTQMPHWPLQSAKGTGNGVCQGPYDLREKRGTSVPMLMERTHIYSITMTKKGFYKKERAGIQGSGMNRQLHRTGMLERFSHSPPTLFSFWI